MKKSTSHHINPHANTSTAPPTTSAGSQSGNLRCRQSPRTHSNFSPPPQPHRFTYGDKDASGRRMAWRWQAHRRVCSEDVQARAWNAQAWRRRSERARARERESTQGNCGGTGEFIRGSSQSQARFPAVGSCAFCFNFKARRVAPRLLTTLRKRTRSYFWLN